MLCRVEFVHVAVFKSVGRHAVAVRVGVDKLACNVCSNFQCEFAFDYPQRLSVGKFGFTVGKKRNNAVATCSRNCFGKSLVPHVANFCHGDKFVCDVLAILCTALFAGVQSVTVAVKRRRNCVALYKSAVFRQFVLRIATASLAVRFRIFVVSPVAREVMFVVHGHNKLFRRLFDILFAFERKQFTAVTANVMFLHARFGAVCFGAVNLSVGVRRVRDGCLAAADNYVGAVLVPQACRSVGNSADGVTAHVACNSAEGICACRRHFAVVGNVA